MSGIREEGADPTGAVRRAYGSDWESYRDLRLRALATDPLAFGSTLAREQAFDDETWKRRLGRPGDAGSSATWVALSATGEWIGLVACAAFEGEPHLFAMWVDPGHRRKGFASRLLETALGWASVGFPGQRVVLDVNPRQVEAVRLYESRGFRATGRTTNLEHTPGERVVQMALDPSRGPEAALGSGRPAGLNSGRQA